MAEIPSSHRDLFEKETFAHFATLMPEGTPQVTPVWVDYDAETDHVLVNTARGEVIDTDALVRALEEDWIRHAALDVTDPEPIDPDHPLMAHAPEKLTVTPHIGSASTETRSEMAVMTAENVLAGLRGETPPYSVFEDAEVE